MGSFALPANLVDSVRANATLERCAWLRRLPDIVGGLAELWSLRVGEPYQPGGRCAWVAPARRAGQELVLKVAWRHDEAADEAPSLRVWAGNGAVRLHDSDMFGSTSALLLERCQPGTTLAEALPEPEQDVVVAAVLRRLWNASTDGYRFRPLQAMCDAWAAEFEQRLARSAGELDRGLARAGIELLRTLPATAGRQVLLCTDLHAGNILAAQREPWLVIDPKPYVGDPTYDALQHMVNCEERLTADPSRVRRADGGSARTRPSPPHRLAVRQMRAGIAGPAGASRDRRSSGPAVVRPGSALAGRSHGGLTANVIAH